MENVSGAVVLFSCCTLGVFLGVYLVSMALILRTTCWLVNVPEPGFLKAMGISLVQLIANGIISFGVSIVASGGKLGLLAPDTLRTIKPGQIDPQMSEALYLLLYLPISIAVSASIFAVMLERCSFGRGILLTLVQTLLTIVVGVILLAVAIGLMFALSGNPLR